MTSLEEAVLQKAMDTWGQNMQIMLFGEECCEAATEVLKLVNGRTNVPTDLISEIADVSIMVDQMRLIWGPQIYAARLAKLERLEQRMRVEAACAGVQS
jgi:hypothetical protein